MKIFRKLVLAGAAVAVVAGAAGVAAAAIKNSHVLTIRLPDGSQEQIRYAGDIPPEITMQPGWTPAAAFAPTAGLFGSASPFAALDRISAQMDREAAAMLSQADATSSPLFGGPLGLTQIDLGKLPPGVQGYSVVSTVTGDGVCTRTVQYGSAGDGAKPKLLTHTSGQCGDAARTPLLATPRTEAPRTVQAAYPRHDAPAIDPAMVHEVSAAY